MRTAGNRLRVTAQLNLVEGGFQIWSRRYDRELNDVFAIQDEIAADIVSALRPEAGPKAPWTRRSPSTIGWPMRIGRAGFCCSSTTGTRSGRSRHSNGASSSIRRARAHTSGCRSVSGMAAMKTRR